MHVYLYLCTYIFTYGSRPLWGLHFIDTSMTAVIFGFHLSFQPQKATSNCHDGEPPSAWTILNAPPCLRPTFHLGNIHGPSQQPGKSPILGSYMAVGHDHNQEPNMDSCSHPNCSSSRPGHSFGNSQAYRLTHGLQVTGQLTIVKA